MVHDAPLRHATEANGPGRLARSTEQPLLEVQGLSVRFDGAPKDVNVVDDVSFSVGKGKTLSKAMTS
jgi:hypothetical protein